MGENNLKSDRTDGEGNSVHKVQETMVGRDIFKVMIEVIDRRKRETGEACLDWGEVFSQILFNYFLKLESVGGYAGFFCEK